MEVQNHLQPTKRKVIYLKKFDDFAADMIPIRLIISVAIIAAISFIVFFGLINLRIVLSENQIENECRNIESKLYSMIQNGVSRDVDETGAGEGTKRVHSFDLPDNVVYLSFGVDPSKDNTGVFKSGLTSDGCVIFYKVEGGSKKVIWFNENFRLREGKIENDKWILNTLPQGYILTNSGSITLTFELVEKNHVIYVLIHGNDEIS
jgi:hypothetical protein